MRVFLWVAAVLLSACSSPVTLNYYQLPAVATAAGHTDASAALYVAPVQVASYLNGRGLVLQLSDVELNVARQHLWAEPLDAQVQRQLRELLAATTPYRTQLSAGQGAVVLSLQLDRFHGTAQGDAVLSGRYQLSHNQYSVPFNINVPLSADGYPALVTALATGLQQLSQQISASLQADSNE